MQGKPCAKKIPIHISSKTTTKSVKQFGRKRVNDQVQRVVTVMKLCTDMEDFKTKFAKVFQKSGYQYDFSDAWEVV